jgi:hypothetical protein
MDSCGMLMDVVGAFGIRIYTYIYIHTVTGAEINMRWAQNIRQNRNVTLHDLAYKSEVLRDVS